MTYQRREVVTDAISVAFNQGEVHLNVHRHLDEAKSVFLSQGILLPLDVARQLGEALIEMASIDAAAAVA